MILYPHLGHEKEKVRIIIEECWIEPREFAMNLTTKDKKKILTYFLRLTQEVNRGHQQHPS
jgi:hypothetical protein